MSVAFTCSGTVSTSKNFPHNFGFFSQIFSYVKLLSNFLYVYQTVNIHYTDIHKTRITQI